MKRELSVHLLPLLGIFLFIALIWSLNRVPIYHHLLLLLGLGIGAFFLDIDHLIYWLFINPKHPDSLLAATAIKHRDYKAIIKLYEITSQKHTNLVFHHFFFQIVLAFVSLFVFSISGSSLILGILLALNLHLLIDETGDYYSNPKHLQDWLFAREEKQLPLNYLGYYLSIFGIICLFLFLTLIQSQLP